MKKINKNNVGSKCDRHSIDYVIEKNSDKPLLAVGIPHQMNFNDVDDEPKNEKDRKKLMVVK